MPQYFQCCTTTTTSNIINYMEQSSKQKAQESTVTLNTSHTVREAATAADTTPSKVNVCAEEQCAMIKCDWGALLMLLPTDKLFRPQRLVRTHLNAGGGGDAATACLTAPAQAASPSFAPSSSAEQIIRAVKSGRQIRRRRRRGAQMFSRSQDVSERQRSGFEQTSSPSLRWV